MSRKLLKIYRARNGTVGVPLVSGLGFDVDLDYLSANIENLERIKIKNLVA